MMKYNDDEEKKSPLHYGHVITTKLVIISIMGKAVDTDTEHLLEYNLIFFFICLQLDPMQIERHFI